MANRIDYSQTNFLLQIDDHISHFLVKTLSDEIVVKIEPFCLLFWVPDVSLVVTGIGCPSHVVNECL